MMFVLLFNTLFPVKSHMFPLASSNIKLPARKSQISKSSSTYAESL